LQGSGLWDKYTWDFHKPDWMLWEQFPGPSGSLRITDLDNSPGNSTDVYDYTSTVPGCSGGVCEATPTSQIGGADNSRIFLKEFNYSVSGVPSCYPAANCTGGGNGPIMRDLDLTTCESLLSSGCASFLGSWNLNLGLYNTFNPGVTGADCQNGLSSWPSTSNYYDFNGHPHQIVCEFGAHDIYYIRGKNQIIWNYGTVGSAAEAVFFSASDTNGTGVIEHYPNLTASVNRGYWGHPAFNATGDLATWEGQQYCRASGTACTDATAGIGYYDERLSGGCILNPTFPACGLVNYLSGQSYAHSGWDGFDNNFLGFDNGGGNTVGGFLHQQIYTATWNIGNTPVNALLYDFGMRSENTGGDDQFGLILGPTESPDGTKIGYTIPLSMALDATREVNTFGHIFYVRAPEPPMLISLASAAAARIQWFASPLNHEAKRYWVWKQASCAGAWTRLASLSAV
ncbi:MAG: hypothetical protein ACRD1L_14580, partial [Terriglobales bacterium]